MAVVGTGSRPELAGAICADRLRLIDASVTTENAGDPLTPARCVAVQAAWPDSIRVTGEIGWTPGVGSLAASGSEAAVQAVSGLMEAHGRDEGTPRRLGIDVASICAGVIAAQAMLAARFATLRGFRVTRVQTSVLEAALQVMAHHIAYATCGDDWMVPPDADGPGPPFRTADERWIEIEALTMESWHEFWTRLGVVGVNLDTAGLLFVLRYTTARCRLPVALHAAVGRVALDEVRSVAHATGVAVCALGSLHDVAADASLPQAPWNFRPARAAPNALTATDASTARDASTQTRGAASDTAREALPLAGVRVVEATSRLQGPLAGLLLQMLGADVVKIEPPGGDTGRISPPSCGDNGAFFMTYNHGKVFVELDLHTDTGRSALQDAIADADVFLHNWRPGRAEELGVGADVMLARHPSLIWAHASGWGDAAPLTPVATEYLVQARTALGASLRPEDEPPFPTHLTIVDTMGGLIACEGVLAALVHRMKTGPGCRVDTSLLSAAMTLQSPTLRDMRRGSTAGRNGRRVWHAFDHPLAASDGWITVVVEDDASLGHALTACGAGAAAPADADTRRRVAESIRAATVSDWLERFAAHGVAALPVCTDLANLEHSPTTRSALQRFPSGCAVPRAPWHLGT